MPIHGIAHYNFRLDRQLMEEVRAFYETVVGLQNGPRPLSSFGYWLYAGKWDVLHLSEVSPGEHRRIGSDLTFDHVALEASDWPAQVQKLHAAGIAFREGVVPNSGRRQLFFRDPAGNGVELIFPAGE
jgi:extradiol dioxygenase family protein